MTHWQYSEMPVNYPIQINYLKQNQIKPFISEQMNQGGVPLLLLEHSQQLTDLKGFAHKPMHLSSGLESIQSQQLSPWCEVWTAKGQWLAGQDTHIHYYENAEFLVGNLSIPLLPDACLQDLSQEYYEQVIDFTRRKNKQCLIRMWNYFPDINRSEQMTSKGCSDTLLERYQQFCVGRHYAFESGPEYPAASAVGSHSSTLVIIFIAVEKGGIFLENPVQTSAYQYPKQYSPQSPSFSRASIYQNPLFNQLWISGTASIIGHESRFPNDIIAQTKQTIENLKILIDHANAQPEIETLFALNERQMPSLAIKVYLRNADDFQKIAPVIQELLPNTQNICYLQGDICRQELDIEIELLSTC